MIDSRVIIEFGTGSTASVYGINEDDGSGVVMMRSVEPGPIGRRLDEKTHDFVKEAPEAVLYFANIDSVDNIISNLLELKEAMATALGEKEKTE